MHRAVQAGASPQGGWRRDTQPAPLLPGPARPSRGRAGRPTGTAGGRAEQAEIPAKSCRTIYNGKGRHSWRERSRRGFLQTSTAQGRWRGARARPGSSRRRGAGASTAVAVSAVCAFTELRSKRVSLISQLCEEVTCTLRYCQRRSLHGGQGLCPGWNSTSKRLCALLRFPQSFSS